MQAAELAGPDVDVLPLERAYLLARDRRERLPVPVLDDDQRPVSEGEVDVPPDQRVDRVAGVVGRAHPCLPLVEQTLADVDEHRRQHGVLGGEVLVERRSRDPASPADLADGDTVEALGGEQLGRGLEDLLPPAHADRLAVVNIGGRGRLGTPAAADAAREAMMLT
jgi:hypothetical protein